MPRSRAGRRDGRQDPRRRGRHRRGRRPARRDRRRRRRRSEAPATRASCTGFRRIASRDAGGGSGQRDHRGRGGGGAPRRDRRDDRHRHADRRRVGHRGHDPRVGVKVGDPSRTATRSSRSRPTRSTWSCRRPPRARSPRSWRRTGETVSVGQVIARMQPPAAPPHGRSRAATAPAGTGAAPTAARPRPCRPRAARMRRRSPGASPRPAGRRPRGVHRDRARRPDHQGGRARGQANGGNGATATATAPAAAALETRGRS